MKPRLKNRRVEVAELKIRNQYSLPPIPLATGPTFPSSPDWIPHLSPRQSQIMIDVRTAIKRYHGFGPFQQSNEIRHTGTGPQERNQSWIPWSMLQRSWAEFKRTKAVDKYGCHSCRHWWSLLPMHHRWQRQAWGKRQPSDRFQFGPKILAFLHCKV